MEGTELSVLAQADADNAAVGFEFVNGGPGSLDILENGRWNGLSDGDDDIGLAHFNTANDELGVDFPGCEIANRSSSRWRLGKLPVGTFRFRICVRAPALEDMRYYGVTVHVTRPKVASLGGITVTATDGTKGQLELVPAFSPDIEFYTVRVPSNVHLFNVKAEAGNDHTDIRWEVNKLSHDHWMPKPNPDHPGEWKMKEIAKKFHIETYDADTERCGDDLMTSHDEACDEPNGKIVHHDFVNAHKTVTDDFGALEDLDPDSLMQKLDFDLQMPFNPPIEPYPQHKLDEERKLAAEKGPDERRKQLRKLLGITYQLPTPFGHAV